MANTVNTAGTSEAGAVSCVTSVFCVAVTGYPGFTDIGHDYAELWNGMVWAPMALPSVAGAMSTTLIGVSCVTTTFCVAVGHATGPDLPLIEQWNGTAWTVVTTSVGQATELDSVSCVRVTLCEAVGISAPDSPPGGVAVGSPVATQWNGTTWTAQSIPSPQGAYGLSTSCTTPTFCMALGISPAFPGPDYGDDLISYLWNGSTWSSDVIAGGPAIFFDAPGISCVGLSFCAATASNSGRTDPVMIWNGSTWSQAQNFPTPGFSSLYGISCFSETSCTAVGDNGSGHPEVVTFDGRSWTVVASPPAGATFLYGVDCLTDWACVTAGSYEFPCPNPCLSNTYQPWLAVAPIARSGYRFVASDGGIFSYGAGAPFLGSMGGTHLNAPIVGMATMPAGDGYYLVASDGGVFAYGSAQFYGSMGGKPLNRPIVGMAATADGAGYWLVASDGGVFSFGDAQFYGSTGAIMLNKPVVGMAASPNGLGYYLVASDGGIFSFGSAQFYGSAGSLTLNRPVVGMAVPPSGGYNLVASDGGVFTYGSSPFYGSAGSLQLNKPIVGMSSVQGGYYLSGSDGGVFTYPTSGGPTFYGSTGSLVLDAPVVAISG
jgi:hypothetical protein